MITPLQAELAALRESNRQFRRKLQEDNDKWFFEELNKDPTQPWLGDYAEIRAELNALNDEIDAKAPAVTNLSSASQPEVTLESLEQLMAEAGKAMAKQNEELILSIMGGPISPPSAQPILPPEEATPWTKTYTHTVFAFPIQVSDELIDDSQWHLLTCYYKGEGDEECASGTALVMNQPTANGMLYPKEGVEPEPAPTRLTQVGGPRRIRLD